ncbi:MAG: DegV family protein [Anaerolineales bacterium]|nr:DegV family protein [Anaerolineales bacterium]
MKTALVTDSTADLPAFLIEQHGIRVVPAILVIAGQSLEDGADISREVFYQRMPMLATPPTTATPSSGTFERLYHELFEQGYEQIISIHVANLLSGIYSTAKMAARAFGDRIQVIDSQSLSMGHGFQVVAAAEAIREGLGITTILERIEAMRQRVHVFAMLDTLEYVRRSGRVSWARARIGALLNIKPFLEVRDGKVLNLGQARTRRKGIDHLLELVRALGPLERLAVLHTNAEQEAHQMLAALGVPVPREPFFVNVTTVVGTHVGPNALGFAAVQV